MNNKGKKYFSYGLLLLASVVVLVFLDQFTKYMAVTHLQNQEDIILIPGALQLHYLENRGAAFGIFQGMQGMFAVVTSVILIALVVLMFKLPQTKRFLPLHVIGLFEISGAIGNLIDRVRSGYVVDFVYFSLIDFPVFNVADIYVTLSTIVLFVLILFYYKDEDYDFLKKKE